MKRKNLIQFNKFIRKKLKHHCPYLRKHLHDSNNDRKRRHKPMIRTCYWRCKYKEVYGKEW